MLMSPAVQLAIVGLAILAAVAYLARRASRYFASRRGNCGSPSCGGCGQVGDKATLVSLESPRSARQ
jgi:hypothetical protein